VVPPSASWSRCVRAAAQTEIPVLVGAHLATLLHLPAYVCGRWSHVVLTHGRWTMTRAVALVVVRPHSSMAAPEARPPPSSPAAQTTPCHHHQLDDRADDQKSLWRRAAAGSWSSSGGSRWPATARLGCTCLRHGRADDIGVDMADEVVYVETKLNSGGAEPFVPSTGLPRSQRQRRRWRPGACGDKCFCRRAGAHVHRGQRDGAVGLCLPSVAKGSTLGKRKRG